MYKKIKHKSHLPQYKVQVRGVVTGWQDIYHCVAAQRQIRAIHAQPYPIGHILCKTWEQGQIAELVACPDVGICVDHSKCLLFSVNLLSQFSLLDIMCISYNPDELNWSC